MDESRLKWLGPVGLGALIGGAALVAASAIVSHGIQAVVHILHQDQRITVTGSSNKQIRSDFIVWQSTLQAQDSALGPAYKKLSAQVPIVVQYLHDQGVTDAELTVSAVEVKELHPQVHCRSATGSEDEQEDNNTISGFLVTQSLEVKSVDVIKIEKASHDVSTLIDRGVYIRSDAPTYIYTKLSDLKIQMLADASRDARNRAEQIAQNAHAQLGSLLSAHMGVIQINPEFSTDVSAEGNNDKSTVEKNVLATVTASFELR